MVLKVFDVIRAFPSLYAMENHCNFAYSPFYEKILSLQMQDFFMLLYKSSAKFKPSASKDYSFLPGPDPVRLKIILLNQNQCVTRT